ncbi:MAG: peptide-methionine (R)-S-oxide reductase MsrB [Campylobacter sp.]|nr:peptide-methionine (R)-S-oxide reductase MsrB [Campylobacter sp.]
MRKLFALIFFAITLFSSENLQLSKDNSMQNIKEIYLAGGCFWGVQAYFKNISGVVSTEVGYANGKSKNATYEGLKQSEHAETLRLKFDANRVDLAEILAHFFRIIDPFSVNRQGNDIGKQYRTGIYYTDESLRGIIDEAVALVEKKYSKKVATQVEPLKHFIVAEGYHQDYLEKNPGGYCHINLDLAKKPLFSDENFSLASKSELKAKLSSEAYAITQEKATERPYTSEFDKFDKAGIYVDITTGKPLFSSSDKFDAGCGWPSFSKAITTDALSYARDTSHGMDRIEVSSRISNSHLGHVFDDGPVQKGGLRYCINGASLRFIPLEKMDEEGYSEYKIFVKEK